MSVSELVKQLHEQPLELLIRHAERLDEEKSLTLALIREKRRGERSREEPRDKKTAD
jgi:hypothetical protein